MEKTSKPTSTPLQTRDAMERFDRLLRRMAPKVEPRTEGAPPVQIKRRGSARVTRPSR